MAAAVSASPAAIARRSAPRRLSARGEPLQPADLVGPAELAAARSASAGSRPRAAGPPPSASPASASRSRRVLRGSSRAGGSAPRRLRARPRPATCRPAGRAGRAASSRRDGSPAQTASAASSVAAAGEDREAARRARRSRLVEQVVAPVDRRPQRLLARQRGPAAAGQQAEAVVEAGGDLLDAAARARARPPARSRAGCRPAGGRLARPPRALPLVEREAGPARPRRARRRAATGRVAGELVERRRRDRARGAASGGTRQAVSPGTPSGSRLVARMRRSGQPRSSALGQPARQASTRCSQLSSTSSSSRPRRCVGRARRRAAAPGGSRTPSAGQRSPAATSAASASGASSTNQTPSA